VRRQRLNVFKMKALGSTVVSVTTGSRTLRGRHQRSPARLDGERRPHPLHHRQRGRPPTPSRSWSATSRRSSAARRWAQCLEQVGRLPDAVVACVGGGSNSAGIFYPFIEDEAVELVGSRGGRAAAWPRGSTRPPWAFGPAGRPARGLQLRPAGRRRPNGRRSTRCPAGLDYPGRRPRAQLRKDSRRVRYTNVGDDDALQAFRRCARWRASCPLWRRRTALDSRVMRLAAGRRREDVVVICFSWPRRQGLLRGGAATGEVI